MGNVIDFEKAAAIWQEIQAEQAASKASAAQNKARLMPSSVITKANADSTDEYTLYHVFQNPKNQEEWEVWLPYNNGYVITYNTEQEARDMARILNNAIGSGNASYTGRPPEGPSYA